MATKEFKIPIRITKDLVGQKFERLTVISLLGSANNRVYWLCRCICGNEKHLTTSDLRNGNTRSCGCLNREWITRLATGQTWARKPKGVHGFRKVLKNYKNAALSRGQNFDLSEEQFKEFTSQNCHYCGAKPSSLSKPRDGSSTLEGIDNAAYVYNGIDRKSNGNGYTMDNCVTCCRKCNFLKGKLNYDEFVEHIKTIYTHLIRR